MVRAMLKDASLPKSFWSDALTCAAYLRNRLPATFLDGKTPIEAISGRQPNMAYIRRFGQHCYIVHPSGRKPDDRGSKCILLGFASLGYKVLELSTRRVTFSRHCAFVDDFGVSSHSVDLSSFDTVFAPDSSGPIPVNDNGSSTSISLDDVDTVDVANPPPVSLQQEGEMPTTPVSDGGTSQVDPLQSSSTDSSRDEPAINETEVNFDGNEHANGETEDTIGDETPVSSDPIQPADPGFQPDQYYGPLDEDLVERITKLALRLMNLVIIGPPVQIRKRNVDNFSQGDEGSIAQRRPKRRIIVPQRYAQEFSLAVVDSCFNVDNVPRSYKEALLSPDAPQWKDAIEAELASLKQHETWSNTEETPKWVLDTTWDIYIHRPQGCQTGSRFLKLKKSLYGLKQSPRCWNSLLDKTLRSFGFTPTPSDPCIYVLHNGDAYIVVYVDDLILCASSLGLVTKFEQFMDSKFSIKKLGDLEFCLGVQISRDEKSSTIRLCQESFINQLLERFSVDQHGLLQPMKVRRNVSEENVDSTSQYRELIGSLLYLHQWTRPDISFAVSYLSGFLSKPSKTHFNAAIDVLRYLKKTKHESLALGGKSTLKLVGYSDADWASDHVDRKSQTGYVFLLGNHPLSWRSIKQILVAASSVEAEYVALNSAVSEALYLQQLLAQLNCPTATVPNFEGNMGAIQLAKNPVHHDGTKHFHVRLHRVRDYAAKDLIKICFTRTSSQLADGLTKPLSGVKFAVQVVFARGGGVDLRAMHGTWVHGLF
ncbi:hypothetical protein AeRB84_009111 [Aphanomyces euteiches]|nr:hypothetical protein AeRB84_014239 [Aphanomyces euteiches]KAH9147221.1 hypothetical protein AeRB84_009111 [Aphanomyces euteiches]